MLNCLEFPHPHLNALLEQGVLTLSIQRPEAKNALNAELYILITQALEEADQSPHVRVVILRGNDTDFTAGNDMKYFLQVSQMIDIEMATSSPPFMFLKSLARFSKPLIAAIRGVAIGVGVTLLFHCDLVYADHTARFQLPFVHLGLSAEGASSLRLSPQAGYHLAAELLLTGQKFNADKALTARFINEIMADPYLHAEQQARHIAALPSAALKTIKSQMKHHLEHVIECIDHEAKIVAQRIKSPEMLEAFMAFLQKRAPDFTQFN